MERIPHLPGALPSDWPRSSRPGRSGLLVTGSNKAEVLTRVVNDTVTDQRPGVTAEEPFERVIWSDQAAAALL